MKKALFIISLFCLSNCTSCQKTATIPKIKAETLSGLNLPKGVEPNNYEWNENSGEIKFTQSLSFSDATNQDLDKEGFYWEIPSKVNTVTIGKNVTITGGLRSTHTVLIQGEDRISSILYGTDNKNWSLGPDKVKDPNTSCSNGAQGDDYVHDCEKWKYGAISSEGNESTIISIENLTIENARSYAITGFKPRFLVDNVHIVNTRPTPDYHSNSDGISAGPGSIIKNSKLDVWDDAIKLYRDFEVENVTIIHNANGAPFQFGWGSGISSSKHSLKNVLVISNNKQHSNLALFSASLTNGAIERIVSINGIKAEYTNGQQVRNEFPMPLIWLKSKEANITLNFTEGSSVSLKAPQSILGDGIFNSNFINRNANNYEKGDPSSITGCGW